MVAPSVLGAALLSATILGTTVLSGCGVTHVDAPELTVVTGVYALAQAISTVGAGQVHVIDLASAQTDPRKTPLSSAQVAEVRRANLVVEVGDGFEPSLEAAARPSARVLALLPAIGGHDPFVWLNPGEMQRVARLLVSALTRIEPAAHGVFADGGEVLGSELGSLDIDFVNTLSDCPQKTFVTADGAFAQLEGRYGVIDHALGTEEHPGPDLVAAAAGVLRSSGTTTAFEESFVDNALVVDAASLAGVKVKTLNTVLAPPVGGTVVTRSYTNLMENDLTAIAGSLRCASVGTN